MYSLHLSLVNPRKARSIDLKTIRDNGSNDHLEEIHLSCDILEVTLEALSLKMGRKSNEL